MVIFSYYLSQKKTLEINPRHPLIKELLKRVEEDPADDKAKNIAVMMFHTGNISCTDLKTITLFHMKVPWYI